MPTRRLGKGISAIISSHQDEEVESGGILQIPLSVVDANPHQPRQSMDAESLAELADSIRSRGVITPITVRSNNGRYMIIAGERRWRAAQLAGLQKIPAYILDITEDVDMMEVALIENIQRENLNPIDEAEAFAVLHGKYNLSQDQIAQAVGKKRVTVTNSLRLLKLPLEIKKSLRNGEISGGHGRALLGLKTTQAQMALWRKILNEGLSVRNAESYVQKQAEQKTASGRPARQIKHSPQIKQWEDELISILGTKVRVLNKKDSGKIEIHYFSEQDLERILDLLRSIIN